MEIADIVAWIGTIAGFLLNVAPMVLYYKIIKGQEKYTIMPESMLILNLLCGELWFCYWYKKGEFIPCLSSSFGLVLGTISCMIYLYFFLEKKKLKWLVGVFITLDLVGQLYYICVHIFKTADPTGNLATVLTVFNYVAPGQNIMKVIREQNSKYIPIASVLSGAFCSGAWFLFGLLKWDIPTIICNGLSLFFASVNTIVWTIYYCKGTPKKDDKEIELNEKDEEAN
jgi:uncharacterized protein with PQ loop repeat